MSMPTRSAAFLDILGSPRVWILRAALLMIGSAGVTLFVRSSIASLDGPSVVEMLGWNPREAKVFFVVYGEREELPVVYYLTLSAQDPNRAQRVAWSDQLRPWPQYGAKLDSLQSTLRPLKRQFRPTIPQTSQILGVDTLRNWVGPWARYRVLIHDIGIIGEQSLLVTCFRDPAVRLVDHYTIPERRVGIVLVSFIGKPNESGYEVQVPVVIPYDRESWQRDTIQVRVPGARP